MSVNDGTLENGAANALPATTTLNVAAGATYDLNGYDQQVAGLGSGTGTITDSAARANTLTVGNLTADITAPETLTGSLEAAKCVYSSRLSTKPGYSGRSRPADRRWLPYGRWLYLGQRRWRCVDRPAQPSPQDFDDQGKVVGRRSRGRRFGFERMEGFAELLNGLRGVDIVRPRGVFRFRSFEEADAWWQERMTARPRRAGRQPFET